MSVDAIKARLVALGFKKATQGLTPEEEKEMAELSRMMDLEKAKQGQ